MSPAPLSAGGRAPLTFAARLGRGPLLALVVAVAAHGWGVGGGFVLDDRPALLDHPVVNGSAPISELLAYNHLGERLDGDFAAPMLRPGQLLFFAAQYRLFGRWAPPYHLASLLLYLLLLIVAHRLFVRLGVAEEQASLAVALFAVLAIHVEVTASIATVGEPLSALLSLLALELALRGSGPAIAASLVSLLAALSVKESAVITPLLFAWLVWGRGELRAGSPTRRRALAALAALVLVSAAFLAWRATRVPLSVQGITLSADNPLIGAPLAARLWQPLVLLGRYLALTLLPLGLAADYSYAAFIAQVDLGDTHGWLGLLTVLVGLGVLASALRGHSRGKLASERRAALGLPALAVGCFVLTYALPSNTAVLLTIIFAERLFLAPSLWLCLLAVLALERVAELAPRLRGFALPALGLFVALQVGLAAARCLDWRSERALFTAQVATEPDSVKGQLFLARRLAASDPGASLWYFGVAMAGRRAFPEPWRAPRPALFPPPSRPRLRAARLARLPALLAPGVAPARVWPRLAAQIGRVLGPLPARVALSMARRSTP